MLRAGVAWHLFALTGSTFQLGLLGLVQFAPALGLVLVGGALADVRERRGIMLVAQSVWLAAASLLAAATLSEAVRTLHLHATVVVVAAATAFDNPARAALLPTLVPRALLPRALVLAATTQALGFATGPALGGVLLALGGPGVLYVVHGGLLLASLGGLALLQPGAWTPGARKADLEAIREGLRFVRRQPVVLGCMLLDMLAVVFGSASALLPVYAEAILGVGPRGYGALAAALEVGALATSLALSFRPPIRRAGRALLLAVAAYGLATVVFGISRWFPLSLLAYALVGVADQVSVVLRSTAIQLSTPDALRGRVSAVNLLFIGASNQLGAAESGFLAALTSAPFAVVSGGIASLVVVGAMALLNPALRRYRIDTPTAAEGARSRRHDA